MSRRDQIQAAYARGELLPALAALLDAHYEDCERLVIELHNEGAINFVGAFDSGELDRLNSALASNLYEVFIRALPQLDCLAEEAFAACARLLEQTERSSTDEWLCSALREWLERDPQRVEEGLAIVRAKRIRGPGNTQSVLLAGASHDRARFAREAIVLSRETNAEIRMDAIRSMGKMAWEPEDAVLSSVLGRLEELIGSPRSDADSGCATQASLRLFNRMGEPVAEPIARLLNKACRNPRPATLCALAEELPLDPGGLDEAALDAAIEALLGVAANDDRTIACIDRALHRWIPDHDRTRVLQLVAGLLGRGEDPVRIQSLKRFGFRLRECSGDVHAWYVVSLLLTGNHRLGNAVSWLMTSRRQGSSEGFDFDLSDHSQTAASIPYLARKILGYCQTHTEHIARLLLSCLRAAPDRQRLEVEDLIFNYFLINYSGALETLKAGLDGTDPARASVRRLSHRVTAYLDAINAIRPCEAFAPSECDRALSAQQQQVNLDAAIKEAPKLSVYWRIAPITRMRYGTRIISYAPGGPNQPPARKERAPVRHTVSVDLEWAEHIDPVGYRTTRKKFQYEQPPE